MTLNPANLTSSDITISLLTGFALCLIYFYLLWRTIGIVKQSAHPVFIIFLSSTLRIFLLVFIALVFSNQNLGRFLIIFCAFFLTRILLLKIAKPSFKQEFTKSEIVYHDEKPNSLKAGLKNAGRVKARKKRQSKR